MKKQKMVKKQHWTQNVFLATMMIMALFSSNSHSCGGGVVPYVPTQTGASGSNTSTSGQFYILEKGAAVSMFDVKKFQPLFRNIILSGNEREKNKKSRKKSRTKNITTAQQTDSDSLSAPQETDAAPVLNIHRLH